MQAHYLADFEREVGCTEAEWLMWLPAAIGDCPWHQTGPSIRVQIDGGALDLRWSVMPPREIALVRLPRLAVKFQFSRVADERRHRFMKRFDLYMQRGGG